MAGPVVFFWATGGKSHAQVRKEAEQSHELLSGEMSHRVKDLLAIVQIHKDGRGIDCSAGRHTTWRVAHRVVFRLQASGVTAVLREITRVG